MATNTYKTIVSKIQGSLNTLTKDTFIPRRLILSYFKTNVEFFISQKLNDKSLFRETNLYKWISCITLIEDDIIKCGKLEFQRCKSLMKSKKKLPELLWSRYGSSIMLVTNLDHSKEYKLISQVDYINLLKRPNADKFLGKFAILYPDNYLYIPDSNIKKIDILIFTIDEKANDLSECDDCKDCNKCDSYWDFEIDIPDKILKPIIKETINDIISRIQIPFDSNPNLDPNQKSQTIQ